LKIGTVFPHNEIGADPGAIKAFAQGVEDLGAEHLLIHDHVLGADPDRPGGFSGPYDKNVRFHEPLTTFAFIAGVTSTINMMSAVMILLQSQTALGAKQAAQVAILSENRFRLGVGTGRNAVEYQGLREDFSNRGRRQQEQVVLLRVLWSQETVDFIGKYHEIPLASINPRPSATIPIWFGGAAPALLNRCTLQVRQTWMDIYNALLITCL
jgi:alkanesulfonate monooxygenase SsuD/methylene tetrahydromethanopterin reductase-like flavin-dependent oxidoreductase (luciferase family)